MGNLVVSLDPRPLSQRFDLTYVRKRSWPHNWIRLLSMIGVLSVGIYFARASLDTDWRMYSSGSLNAAHSMFANDCRQCHRLDEQKGRFWRSVTDRSCLRCHAGSAHHPEVARTLADVHTAQMTDRLGSALMASDCASCHREHRGRNARIAQVPDPHCVRCHGDLESVAATDAGAPYSAIHSFVQGHPEWRVLEEQPVDESAIRMGHALHMDPRTPQMQSMLKRWAERLREEGVPDGSIPMREVKTENEDDPPLLTMTCTACHQGDEAGRYMRPIEFEQHCQPCHGLGRVGQVRLPGVDTAIPHGSEFVPWAQHVAFEAATSRVKAKPRAKRRRGPRSSRPKSGAAVKKTMTFEGEQAVADQVAAWVTAANEKIHDHVILRGTCAKCHGPDAEPGRIADPNIPDRWLPASTFSHGAHRFVGCTECHQPPGVFDEIGRRTRRPDVPEALRWTEATSDLMLPGIDLCRKCHQPKLEHGLGGARHDCGLCHLYHDPPVQGHEGGAFVIHDGARPLRLVDVIGREE